MTEQQTTVCMQYVKICNSFSQHVKRCYPTVEMVQTVRAGFHRHLSGDLREWRKITEGLFLGHRGWEKAVNKGLVASGSGSLKNEECVKITEPWKSPRTVLSLAYSDDHRIEVPLWTAP